MDLLGSWVVIRIVALLITPFITAHEPPSRTDSEFRGLGAWIRILGSGFGILHPKGAGAAFQRSGRKAREVFRGNPENCFLLMM